MKLVELLAEKIKEWPEGAKNITQDHDGSVSPCTDPHNDLEFDGSRWSSTNGFHMGLDIIGKQDLSSDYKTAIVTRAQWQAERDRQKGGEWKRHRGGKQPVANDTQVECRMRNGDIEKFNASGFMWDHNGQDDDIMAYRVISQPQAEEVEVNTFVGRDVQVEYAFSQEGVSMEDLDWKPIGGKLTSVEGVDPALFGEVEDVQLRDTLSTYKEFTVTGQWHQIDGPIKWRDTVNELDAYIEEFTRERDALIERLDSEGFALIPPAVSVMSEFSGVDMSDWRNWKAGDIVECITSEYNDVYTIGQEYTIEWVKEDVFSVYDNYGENSSCDWFGHDAEGLKFVRRQ